MKLLKAPSFRKGSVLKAANPKKALASSKLPKYLVNEDWWYWAKVVRNKDGDTFVFNLDLGVIPIALPEFEVRVYDLDTYESSRIRRGGVLVSAAEVEMGQKASAFAKKLCPPGTSVRIRTYKASKVSTKAKTEKYGRYLAEVFLLDAAGTWRSYRDVMIAEGFDRRLKPL
jgi:endonuclease YncB( thermonuclease family)